MKKHWYDYLWILSLTYLILGFFNILFAWLGLLCFFIPLIISVVKGTKGYCNRYCGRGQLFDLLGGRFGFSRKKDIPKWMKSKWFRYGFLIFFFVMFFQMLWNTWLVFSDVQDLKQVVTLLWTFKVPWRWRLSSPRHCSVRLWILQCHADLNDPWFFHYGFVQASKLVRLLSHGDYDAADLQGKTKRSEYLTFFVLSPF